MTGIIAQFLPWIGTALVAVLAVLGLTRSARKQGTTDQRAKATEQTMARAKAGQGAAARASADNRTPEQIARENDGAWK